MQTRIDLGEFLLSADQEKLRQLFIDALFKEPAIVIAGRETETFATEFNLAFDSLKDVATRILIQDTCASVLQAIPWRHADQHLRGLVELLAIARHTCSLSASRFLFEMVQRDIQQSHFQRAWAIAGDLMVTTIIEPMHYLDVQDYARRLFFDPRFEDCALIAFFRLAEIQPKSCAELIPRFLKLFEKLEEDRPDELLYVKKRFGIAFDLSAVKYLLETLKLSMATDLADRVLSGVYTIKASVKDPDPTDSDFDVPNIAYSISMSGSSPLEVNPVPFIRRALRRARGNPYSFPDLREVRADADAAVTLH